MTLYEWNIKEIKEAIGDTSRYYYWLETRIRDPTPDMLIMWFVDSGRAKAFRESHEQEID